MRISDWSSDVCSSDLGEQGMNVARIGALLAGLPIGVPAQTINRFCSSGVQAVALAADRIRLGEADLMLAGGTESMRSEERRVGHGCVSPGRSRWSPYH